MPRLAVDLSVRSEFWSCLPQADAVVRRAAAAVAASATDMGRIQDGDEVCVVLGDDAMIRELNGRWRKKDAATNVLSFPSAFPTQGDGARPLGDVVLAFETVEREAREIDKPMADHLAHLVVHGVLHLLGHDHIENEEAERMEALEASILMSIGIADPYATQAV